MLKEHATEGSNWFVRLFHKKTDITNHPPISDFEQELFRNGVYVFDPNKEIYDAEKILLQHKDWMDRNWGNFLHRDSFDDKIAYEKHHILWKQAFSGLIPIHWSDWREVKNDFEKGRELNIQLNPTLVDAGVTHSSHFVVRETGRGQKLQTRQLAVVIARKEVENIPGWNYEEIIQAQESKGLSKKDFDKAKDLAKKIVSNLRNRKGTEQGLILR